MICDCPIYKHYLDSLIDVTLLPVFLIMLLLFFVSLVFRCTSFGSLILPLPLSLMRKFIFLVFYYSYIKKSFLSPPFSLFSVPSTTIIIPAKHWSMLHNYFHDIIFLFFINKKAISTLKSINFICKTFPIIAHKCK